MNVTLAGNRVTSKEHAKSRFAPLFAALNSILINSAFSKRYLIKLLFLLPFELKHFGYSESCSVAKMLRNRQHPFDTAILDVMRMKCTIVLMVLTVSVCRSENFLCKFIENNHQTDGYYCGKNANTDGQMIGNCSTFPDDYLLLHSNISQLKFSGCDREFMQKTSESALNLISIDISNAGYESLNLFDLTHKRLQKLNVSHNELPEMPKLLLCKVHEIVEVDFSHNKLQRIDSQLFQNTTKLRAIHLSHNTIMHIDEGAFANLTHLEYIDLSDNKIRFIETLRNNKQLKTLLATNNPMSFDCHDTAKMGNVSVFVSFKNVEMFNTNCEATEFHVIPNSTIEGVFAIAKGKYEIHCNEQSLENIQQLTAGRNKIVNLSEMIKCVGGSVKRLALSGNSIGTLNITTFERFIHLEWLYLKDAMLSDFDLAVLKNQNKLKKLDVSNNNLTHVKNAESLEMFELQEFKMAGNRVENINQIIHHLRPSIKVLDLSGNPIGKITATMFSPFKNLRTLKLGGTNLSMENHNPFEQLKNLEVLDISQNNLENVNFTLISPTLSNLTYFLAANCQIANTVNVIRCLGPSLLELDLSINPDSDFDLSILKYKPKLRTFRFAFNELREADMSLLPKQLVRIDLKGNNLTKLINFSRSHFSRLESLSLSKNRFPCHYLTQLKNDWKDLRFSVDLFRQKHGDDCRRRTQGGHETEVTPKTSMDVSLVINIPIKMSYVIAVTVITVVLSCLTSCYFIYRKRLLERAKVNTSNRVSTRINMLESELYRANEERIPFEASNGVQVYEEIRRSEEHYYDQLRFETDPLPLATNNTDGYHNFSLLHTNRNRLSIVNRI